MAAQLPDKINVNGEWKYLFTNPLEEYWTTLGKKPAFCGTEECTRGYIASWEITSRGLLLRDIEGQITKSFMFFGPKIVKAKVSQFFPRYKKDERDRPSIGRLPRAGPEPACANPARGAALVFPCSPEAARGPLNLSIRRRARLCVQVPGSAPGLGANGGNSAHWRGNVVRPRGSRRV